MEKLKIKTLNEQRLHNGRDKMDRIIKRQIFLKYLNKHKFKILGVTAAFLIIVYPELVGSVLGQWLNDFVTSFSSNIKF